MGSISSEISFDQYKQIDAVNASFIKRFAKCPAEAHLPMETTRNMVIGSAVHALALEGEESFLSQYTVAPNVDKRTKDGKATWAEFQEANQGKELLTADEMMIVNGCVKSLKAHPLASRMLRESEGQPEVTLQWIDEATGLDMKSRLDRLPLPDKRTIIDIKTTSDASLHGFTRQIVNMLYDLQAAVYTNGAKACGIDVDSFVFIAVQNSAPFQVSVVAISDEWMSWAQSDVDRQLGLIKQCKVRGIWPAHEIPRHIYDLDQITVSDLMEVIDLPKYR